MVLVPIHRVSRRLLGLFAIVSGLVALFLLLGQVHHVYHQHLKFRRYESYNHYVDDVKHDLFKLEILANRSSVSMDQILSILGQQPMQTKPNLSNYNTTNNDQQSSR